MTNPSWQAEEPEQQWTQPPFAPGATPQPAPGRPSPSGEQPPVTQSFPFDPGFQQFSGWGTQGVVQGGALVPRAVQVPYPTPVRVPPAGPAEVLLRAIGSVLFPVMIALAIFGPVPWVTAIIIALVVPGILNRLARDMKQRRVSRAQYEAQAGYPPQAYQPGPENDLR